MRTRNTKVQSSGLLSSAMLILVNHHHSLQAVSHHSC